MQPPLHSSYHSSYHSPYTPFPIKKIISHIKQESLLLSLSFPIPTLSFIPNIPNIPNYNTLYILLFAILPFLLLLLSQKLISSLQKRLPSSSPLFFLHSILSLSSTSLSLSLSFLYSNSLTLIILHIALTSASLTLASIKIVAFLKRKNLSLSSNTPIKTKQPNPTLPFQLKLQKILIHSLLQYPILYSALAFHSILLSLSLISSLQINPNPLQSPPTPKTPQPHHSLLISLHNPKLKLNPSSISLKTTKLFLQSLNSNIQNLPSISSSFSQYPTSFFLNHPHLSFKTSSLSSFHHQLKKFYHSLLFQHLGLSLNLSQFKPPIPPKYTFNTPFIHPQNFTQNGFFINNQKSSFLIFAKPLNHELNLLTSQTLSQDLKLAFSKTQKQFSSQPQNIPPFSISYFSPHFQLLQNLSSSIHDFQIFSSISLLAFLLLIILYSRSILSFLLLILPLLIGTIFTFAFSSLFFTKINTLSFFIPFIIIPFVLTPASQILPQLYQNLPPPVPLFLFLKSSKPLLTLSSSSSILSLLPSLSNIPEISQFSIIFSIASLTLPSSFLFFAPLFLILSSKSKTWINQSAPYTPLKKIISFLKTPTPYLNPSYIHSQHPIQTFFHSLSKNYTPFLITSLILILSSLILTPLLPPQSIHSSLSFKIPQKPLNNHNIPSQFQIKTSPTILTTSPSKQYHILQSLNQTLKQPSPPFHSFHSLSSYTPKLQHPNTLLTLKIQKLAHQISKLPQTQFNSQNLIPPPLWKKKPKKTPNIISPPKPITQLFKNQLKDLSIYIFPHQKTLSNPQKLNQFSEYILNLTQLHHIPQTHINSPHLLIHKLQSQSKNYQTLIILLSTLGFLFFFLLYFKNTQHSLIFFTTTLSSLSFLVILLFCFNIPLLNPLNLLLFPLVLLSSSSFPFLIFHQYLLKQTQPLVLIFKNITPNSLFSFLILSPPLLSLSSSHYNLSSSISLILILSFTSSFLSSFLILPTLLSSKIFPSKIHPHKKPKSKTLI